MVKEENKAIIEENKQQARATDALKQVRHAMKTLATDNARQEPISLGEQQAPSAGDHLPLNQALNQLSQVASSLKQGTQTSHTMHKIEHMQKEAKQLMQQSYQDMMVNTHAASDSAANGGGGMGGMMDPVLGEGHPNDESALAALSHPQANEGTANNEGGNVISAQAAETEVQAEAEAVAEADREAEASSQPQTANQEGGKAVFETDAEAEAEANQASNDVSTETQELQNIMTEEGQVESSE